MRRNGYLALLVIVGFHFMSIASAQTNNPYVFLFPDCEPRGGWGLGSGTEWPHCDAAKAEAARRGISVEQAYAEVEAAKRGIPVEEHLAKTKADAEVVRAEFERREAEREKERAEAEFWEIVVLAVSATICVAIILVLIKTRRRIAASLSRRWRRRSKDFRAWVFLSFFWSLGVILYVWLGEPYGSSIYDDDFRHMLGVIIIPPLFFGALWFSYKRFVNNDSK